MMRLTYCQESYLFKLIRLYIYQLQTMESRTENPIVFCKKEEDRQISVDQNVDLGQKSQLRKYRKKCDHIVKKNCKNKKQYNLFQAFFSKKTVNKSLPAWKPVEIKNLFKFYDEYGPQWQKMSRKMHQRTANDLKNRFYTVLRNLVKLLFRNNPQKCVKQTGEISSKELCRLYDGRQKYQNFTGFIKSLLESIEYDIEKSKINNIAYQNQDIIFKIYQIFYPQKEVSKDKTPSQPTEGHVKLEENNTGKQIRTYQSLPANTLNPQFQQLLTPQQNVGTPYVCFPSSTDSNCYFWFPYPY